MGVHWKWVAKVRRKFRKSKPRNTIIVVHINNSRSLSIGGSTTGGDEEEEVKAVETLEVIEEKGSEEIVERTEAGVDQKVDGNETVEGNRNADRNDQHVQVNQNVGNRNADGNDQHVQVNQNADGKGIQNVDRNDKPVEGNQNADGKGNQNAQVNQDADGKGNQNVEVNQNANQNADGKGNQNADGNDQHVEGNQNVDGKGNQNADGNDQHVEGNQNVDGKGNQNADGTSQPVEENQNADGNGGSQWKKEVGLPEAALRIQSFFRGYLARRAFQALRSLVKMQAMVRGVRTRKQSHIALNCMQVLVRLQERVRTRQLLSSVGDNSPLNNSPLNDSSMIKEVEVQKHVAASIPLSA